MPCRDPGSSWGPSDLQSDALPTELSRLCAKTASAVQNACTPWGNTILGSLWIRRAGFWLLWPSGPRILSRDWCKGLADVRIHTWNKGPNVASEDRTHNLRIMRPAHCQLRYCHLSWGDKQHVQALVGRQKQDIG